MSSLILRDVDMDSNRKSKKGNKDMVTNCFAIVNPGISKEWHPILNGNLSPYDLKAQSNRLVWWICSQGHEWKARVQRRHLGDGCPYCSGRKVSKEYNLASTNPDLALQWHPHLNGNLRPANVTPGSNSKVWWICDYGHVWETRVYHRSSGSGCPYCKGRKK
jgi:hypothetical protein